MVAETTYGRVLVPEPPRIARVIDPKEMFNGNCNGKP